MPKQNSMYPGGGGAAGGLPEQLMNNPMMTNMAMQYGQDIVGRGGEEIKKNLDKFVSIGQLKYYFAVDTAYVGKKLGILLFPFTRTDWAIKVRKKFSKQSLATRSCAWLRATPGLETKKRRILLRRILF